jgi:hypothetical protein
MLDGLSSSDYLFAGVTFFVFVATIVVLVYMGWRTSTRKNQD